MSLHAQDWLDAYLDGELSPTELARAEQHLAVCAECRALLAQRRKLLSLLQDAPQAQLVRSEKQFIAEISLQMERRPLPEEKKRTAWFWWAIPLGLLLAGGFVIAIQAASLVLNVFPSWQQELTGVAGAAPAIPLVSGELRALVSWLGIVPVMNWDTLTSIVILVLIALMYLGWLALWWTSQRSAPMTEKMERIL